MEKKKSRFGFLNLFKRKDSETQTTSQNQNQSQKEDIKEEKIEVKETGEEISREELEKKYGEIKEEIPERTIEPVEEIEDSFTKNFKEEGEELSLPNLLLRLEKLDGKLEILEKSRDELTERMTQLAEEIGELRSMFLERERSFDKMKAQFEKVYEIVTELEPLKIRKEFEKKEAEILKLNARMEKVESLLKALREENTKFREFFEKIKSFENIVDIHSEIEKKLSAMNEVKKYVARMASKVESIFSEVNQKVNELEEMRGKVEKLDELTIELTKMLDEISVKLNKFLEKKEWKGFAKNVEERLDRLEKHEVLKVKGPEIDAALKDMASKILKLKEIVEAQNNIIMNILERMEGGTLEAVSEEPEEEYYESYYQ